MVPAPILEDNHFFVLYLAVWNHHTAQNIQGHEIGMLNHFVNHPLSGLN